MRVRLALFLVFFILLPACASTKMAEELQRGKISFEDGNFNSAFHQLLPLASEGNPQAEYAVGYMYYYGYGTTQDNESGLFWMNKSANQHYEPAIKALAIIKENKVSEEPTQQLTEDETIKTDSQKILYALSSAPPLDKQEKNPERRMNQETDTLMNQAADSHEPIKKYTLQLMGSYDPLDIQHTQDRLHIEKTSQCVRAKRNGRDWYVLAYGQYQAPYLAKLAIDNLPPHLRQMNPWVRKLA